MKNKKTKALLLAGIMCLTIAFALFLVGGNSAQKNLSIMRSSSSPSEIAQEVAKNNRNEATVHMLRMFLLGIGGTLTLFSGIVILKEKP